MHVKTGLEVLRQLGYKPLHGLKVGLLTNPSAVDQQLESAYSILCSEPNVKVTALFSPEHGLGGVAAAGEHVQSGIDPVTGLPIHSLYGNTLKPTAEMLKGIDVIVCDVQDVGARYFTYVWTISYILEAAGEHDVTVVLLDRPNPLGGKTIEGPCIEPDFLSFVGRCPVPVRHGLTLGELTWMINETWNPSLARLSIISCENYEREMTWAQTRLPWVAPSPNLPTLESVLHYPGACLIEGTNLSEGRGTALPFQIVGASWVDAPRLVKHLNTQAWAAEYGVRFRPHSFRPTISKHAGEACQGVQVHLENVERWRPIEVYLHLIQAIRQQHPDQFQWLPPYSEGDHPHFDKLTGTDSIRQAIDAGQSIETIAAGWKGDIDEFATARQPFLLYE
ncbi:MAG: DUF1343 domain-containing protein [bacterium]|nr:DUF1343 domain-containing protein [bacterium]